MLTSVLLASRRCFKGALSAQLLSSRSVVSRPEGHLSRQVHQPLPVRAASNFPPRWDESKTFDQRNQPPASSYTRKWPHGVAAHAGMKGVCEFGSERGAASGWMAQDTPFCRAELPGAPPCTQEERVLGQSWTQKTGCWVFLSLS